MRWLISLLAVLWVVPAVAEDWTRLPPIKLIYSKEARQLSNREVDKMAPDQLEAFRQMLAACGTFYFSKNEMVTAPCDRSVAYFKLVYVQGGALLDLLNALQLFWTKWRSHTGAVGDGSKEIEQLGEIWRDWIASVQLRRMQEEREKGRPQ